MTVGDVIDNAAAGQWLLFGGVVAACAAGIRLLSSLLHSIRHRNEDDDRDD